MRKRNKKRIALLLITAMLSVNISSVALTADYDIGNAAEQEQEEPGTGEEFQEEREEELLAEDCIIEVPEEKWGSEEELILDPSEEIQRETAEPETAGMQASAEDIYAAAKEEYIDSIELTLAKSEYTAGVDAYFVSGAAITFKNQDGQILENGMVKGDSYTISKMSAGKVKFWAQNDAGNVGTCAPLDQGEYHVGVTVGDKWYQTDAILHIKSLKEMCQGELIINTETSITASQNWGIYGYNWYAFRPARTGMYQVNPCDVLEIYTLDQDQKPVQEYRERDEDFHDIVHFYARAGETYYLGFSGNMDGQATWNVTVSQYQNFNEVVSMTLRPEYKRTANCVFNSGSYVDAVIDIIYANGESDWITIGEEGMTGDDRGHCFRCYLTDGEGQKVTELSAGYRIVHIEYVNNPRISVSYLLELTAPDNISLRLNQTMSGRLRGGSQCYSFVPEKTGNYLLSLSGNFNKSLQAGLWLYGEKYNEFYDLKTSKKISKTFKEGKRYFFVVIQGDDLITSNYVISIGDREHIYEEETKNPDCITDGYVRQICSICGAEKEGSYQKIPMTGHDFGAYITIKRPTALETGTKTRTCNICGYVECTEIAKLVSHIRLTTSRLPLQIRRKVSLNEIVTGLAEGDYLKSAVSANRNIATVNNQGTVTGVQAGNVRITLNFASGVSRNVTIVVQKTKVEVTRLMVPERDVILKVKSKKKLAVRVTPVTSRETIRFQISDKRIAAVSETGIITARTPGRAVLVVRAGRKIVKVRVVVIQ